jgi:long-chain acyl-CoA synthetase
MDALAKDTLVDFFQRSASEHADTEAMKYKRGSSWHSITYGGFRRFVEDLAGGLLSLGIEDGDRVAIWSANSPEWVIADYATLHVGAASAPVYDTLTPEQAEHILDDSGARVVFVEDQDKLDAVLAASSNLDALEYVVTMGPLPEGYEAKAEILGMDELYARGRSYLDQVPDALQERYQQLTPGDLASLVYTSGTTGVPKGVKLTHRNFASNVQATVDALEMDEEVHLGFLPLAHSFARTGDQFVPYSTGSTVCFAEGVDELVDNMQEVSPTVVLSVPRLYEKMHSRIVDKIESKGAVAQRLFEWAKDVGREVAQHKIDNEPLPTVLAAKHAAAKRLVLDQIQETTGGRLRFFVSGGAALNPDIMEFFASVGLWIMQGYGLTETSPVISANTEQDYRIGSVGKPIDEVEVRIAEELWDGSEDEGEIQVQGPNVTEGYYGLPEETAELFTDDGWLRTGDVGRIDEDGFLYVTDRLKKIFKTAYGKYIVPNKIEGKFKQQSPVEQAVVIGEDRKYVSALFAPDFEQLEAWAEDEDLEWDTHEDLVDHERVQQLFERAVERVNGDLARYESVKKFTVLSRVLDQVHDELTPTLKVKRRVVHEHFADEIDGMYPDE